MKRTKDLEEFIEGQITNCDLHQEYIVEIVKRLRAYDRIKKEAKTYEQIVALIQKPGVTEEWIEEKARELRKIKLESDGDSLELVFLTQAQAKDFIRSLVVEIHGRK